MSNYDKEPFDPQYVRTVTMCIHISPVCNLNCKYCFKSVGGELTFDDARRFIDIVTQIYPRADRYIVDMSGAGEPLLRMDLLFNIAEYCKVLSNKYLREFLPTVVTNGTLLTEDAVIRLQSSGVLFGVSLDGTKTEHDRNRVFRNGSGSYDIVERNVRNIKNNRFVGAAVTFTEGDLLSSFLNAYGLLPTVSMKPVRYFAEKAINADAVCKAYDELISFLLNAETEYIYALLNGDDYFGKFLRRVALKINVYGRCDAGIGRFALAGDKNIYCCPAACGIQDGRVGSLDNGIRISKIHAMWEKQRNDICHDCVARGACGGECKIVSYNKYGNFDGIDGNMCSIKRYLYISAVRFIDELADKKPKIYESFVEQCRKVESYYDLDKELVDAVKLSQGKYTFTEMKSIKDSDPQRFKKIYLQFFSKGGIKNEG